MKSDCPKCGQKAVIQHRFVWVNKVSPDLIFDHMTVDDPALPEFSCDRRLKFTCACGWFWYEMTLDDPRRLEGGDD